MSKMINFFLYNNALNKQTNQKLELDGDVDVELEKYF